MEVSYSLFCEMAVLVSLKDGGCMEVEIELSVRKMDVSYQIIRWMFIGS